MRVCRGDAVFTAMTPSSYTVVKVGGSLFDLPDLAGRLRRYLTTLPAPVLVVPGGGVTADAIRTLDRVHELGEETAHWLAIQALSINAQFLRELLAAPIVAEPHLHAKHGLAILDAYPFFLADEANRDHVPHCWEVTSDSLAVRAATISAATELILLKSTTWASANWEAAAKKGIVDGYFPQAIRHAPAGLRTLIVNFRDLSLM